MKKPIKIVIGAVSVAVGIYGIINSTQETKATSIVTGIILIVAGLAWLFITLIKFPNLFERKQSTEIPENKNTTPKIDGDKQVNLLSLSQNDYMLIYEYVKSLWFPASDNPYDYILEKAMENKRQIEFRESEDDEDGIDVYLEGKKIGYVEDEMILRMIHDFARQNYEVCAHINTFNRQVITFRIGFYKPKSACRKYTIPIRSKKVEEEYVEGDMLSVEYDSFERRFVLLDCIGEKICVLPEEAEDYAREYHEIPVEVGEDGKSIVFFK